MAERAPKDRKESPESLAEQAAHKRAVRAVKMKVVKIIAAGTAATAGWVSLNRINPPTQPVHVSAQAPETSPHETVVGGGMPLPSISADKSRIVRTEIYPPAEKIGTLIDVTSDSLAHYRLQFTERNGHFSLDAIPQAESGKTVYATYAFKAFDADPLYALPDHASKEMRQAALQRWRANFREKYFGLPAPSNSQNPPNPKAQIQAIRPLVDSTEDRIHLISDISEKDKIVLRISLTPEIHHWLKQVLDMPLQLKQAVETDPSSIGEITHILKEVLIDPKTGTIDNMAKETLLRMFALSPEARAEFAHAITNNDVNRARMLLLYHTPSPVPAHVFQALLDYTSNAKAQQLDTESIRQSIYSAILDYGYGDLSNTPGPENLSKALRVLQNTIPEIQYHGLEAIPESALDILVDFVVSERPNKTYDAFCKEMHIAAECPDKITKHGILLPPHMLPVLQHNLSQFMGSKETPGWLDNTDKELNIVTQINNVVQREQLAELAKIAQVSTESNVAGILDIKSGNPYLTFEITPRMNAHLTALNNVLHAARMKRVMPGTKYADTGHEIPLTQRVTEFLADGHRNLTEYPADHAMPPQGLIRLISQLPSPPDDVVTALGGSSKPSPNLTVSGSEAIVNGIITSSITKGAGRYVDSLSRDKAPQIPLQAHDEYFRPGCF